MRGKTCHGYNTILVNYVTAAVRSNACSGCNASAGNYTTGAMRGKNCCGCKRARDYVADAKRGNTRKLPMQPYSLFHDWEARSCFDMFAQNCLNLGGVGGGGCHGQFIPIF